jgi:hypothetical protein
MIAVMRHIEVHARNMKVRDRDHGRGTFAAKNEWWYAKVIEQ